MSGAGRAGRRRQREVVDVAEPVAPDRSLDQLLHVRKQRLDRFERERREAREAWRAARLALRQNKLRWRAALALAHEVWREARAQFFKMATTSGQMRRAKGAYERMKGEAMELQLECRDIAARARAAGAEFFVARRRVLQANRQQEKLAILRDEIGAAARQGEQ